MSENLIYSILPPWSNGFSIILEFPKKSTENILLMLFFDIRVTSIESPGWFKHPVTATLDARSFRRRPR